jgi:metal-responsive CopG/Arc/MetJ family transcriptional regulator
VKTAISIPDDVFRAAEATARRTGKSRSQLFTEAMRLFLEVRAGESITEQLNRVYERVGSKVDPVLSQLQSEALLEEW